MRPGGGGGDARLQLNFEEQRMKMTKIGFGFQNPTLVLPTDEKGWSGDVAAIISSQE